MAEKKSAKATRLPEAMQLRMRKRLEVARLASGKKKSEVETVSASGLNGYEQHDISTLKLGDIYGLAQEYGLTFEELVTTLVNGAAVGDGDAVQLVRFRNYFRHLDEMDMDLLTNLANKLASNHIGRRVDEAEASQAVARAKKEEVAVSGLQPGGSCRD